MTEKQQPLPPRPDQTQIFHYPSEDEISLVDVLKVLLGKKVLLLATTSIFTLLSILYAKSITPTYEASTSFIRPQESYFALLPSGVTRHLPSGNKVDNGSYNSTPFTIFLSKITSFKFQEEVFKDGEFLKKFHGESSATQIESVMVGIHNSIKLSKQKANIEIPYFEESLSLKMTGSKPKAMSEFLNVLVESAKQASIKEIKNLISLIVEEEIIKISREIDILRSVVVEKNIKDRIDFSEALTIARNLGIKNNNFDKARTSNIDIGVSSKAKTSLDLRSTALESFLESQEKTIIKVQDTTLPVWYLYGEKALQQELDMILSRKEKAPIPGMSLKSISLRKYKSIDPSSLEIKVAIISQPSFPPTGSIASGKRKIVVAGFALGLLVGLIVVFLGHLATQLREKETPSASATESSTR